MLAFQRIGIARDRTAAIAMVVGWFGDRTERCASPAQRYDPELEKADNKWFSGILALSRSQEKSICTAGLLATIITSKFVDAMPFYRQEKQFALRGIDLLRTLMCNWTLAVWEKYRVIEEIFREELLKFPLVHADETPFQVLREEGRKVQQKSYMWLFCGGPPGKGIVCYKYAPSRSGDVAQEYLGGYKGYVVTDGYKGYDYLDDMEGVTHAACWAQTEPRQAFFSTASSRRPGPTVWNRSVIFSTCLKISPLPIPEKK